MLLKQEFFAIILFILLTNFFTKFRPKNFDNQAVLVLDIGTEFSKALIFQIEDSQAFIKGYGKVRQKPGNMLVGAVTDIVGVTGSCQEAIEIASRMAGFRPEQAIVGIAGELIRGLTMQLKYLREAPLTRIDLTELKLIIQQIQGRALKQVRQELALDVPARELDLKFVHSAIIDARIDNQPALNPIGFQGHEVTLTVFNSFAPLVHFGALKTVAAELELDLLAIVLDSFALARLFADEHIRSLPAIFLDVGGGTTDLAVSTIDGKVIIKTFAIGGQTFTKRLAQILNVNLQEAERLKLAYVQGALPARQTKKIHNSLKEDSEVWLAGVELALAEVAAESKKLPSKIFLCGGGAKLPELKQALATASFRQNLPFINAPVVRFLFPDDLNCFTDETKLLTSVQDLMPLALAKLGWQLAGKEKLLSKILRQAVRLLKN